MKKMIRNLIPPIVGTRVRILNRKNVNGIGFGKDELSNIFGRYHYEGVITEVLPVKMYRIEGKTRKGYPLTLTYYRNEFEVIG